MSSVTKKIIKSSRQTNSIHPAKAKRRTIFSFPPACGLTSWDGRDVIGTTLYTTSHPPPRTFFPRFPFFSPSLPSLFYYLFNVVGRRFWKSWLSIPHINPSLSKSGPYPCRHPRHHLPDDDSLCWRTFSSIRLPPLVIQRHISRVTNSAPCLGRLTGPIGNSAVHFTTERGGSWVWGKHRSKLEARSSKLTAS